MKMEVTYQGGPRGRNKAPLIPPPMVRFAFCLHLSPFPIFLSRPCQLTHKSNSNFKGTAWHLLHRLGVESAGREGFDDRSMKKVGDREERERRERPNANKRTDGDHFSH